MTSCPVWYPEPACRAGRQAKMELKDILNCKKGKEELNFYIPASKSTTFRYRVIVNSGSHLTDVEINAFADDFAKKY